MQAVFRNLPEDLKHLVETHRYNRVVSQLEDEFRSWAHFGVMQQLWEHTSEWSLYEDPSERLLELVNEDRHSLQHGFTDFEKYVDNREVLLMQYEEPEYELGVCCSGCVEDGSFPCGACSQGPLNRWVCEGCFDVHNLKGWPIDDPSVGWWYKTK